jgi:hypothetical protein
MTVGLMGVSWCAWVGTRWIGTVIEKGISTEEEFRSWMRFDYIDPHPHLRMNRSASYFLVNLQGQLSGKPWMIESDYRKQVAKGLVGSTESVERVLFEACGKGMPEDCLSRPVEKPLLVLPLQSGAAYLNQIGDVRILRYVTGVEGSEGWCTWVGTEWVSSQELEQGVCSQAEFRAWVQSNQISSSENRKKSRVSPLLIGWLRSVQGLPSLYSGDYDKLSRKGALPSVGSVEADILRTLEDHGLIESSFDSLFYARRIEEALEPLRESRREEKDLEGMTEISGFIESEEHEIRRFLKKTPGLSIRIEDIPVQIVRPVLARSPVPDPWPVLPSPGPSEVEKGAIAVVEPVWTPVLLPFFSTGPIPIETPVPAAFQEKKFIEEIVEEEEPVEGDVLPLQVSEHELLLRHKVSEVVKAIETGEWDTELDRLEELESNGKARKKILRAIELRRDGS